MCEFIFEKWRWLCVLWWFLWFYSRLRACAVDLPLECSSPNIRLGKTAQIPATFIEKYTWFSMLYWGSLFRALFVTQTRAMQNKRRTNKRKNVLIMQSSLLHFISPETWKKNERIQQVRRYHFYDDANCHFFHLFFSHETQAYEESLIFIMYVYFGHCEKIGF